MKKLRLPKALLIFGLLWSLGVFPVQASAQCVAPPSNLVNWWPGDGNADDVQGSINGILVGDTTGALIGSRCRMWVAWAYLPASASASTARAPVSRFVIP